MRKGFLLKASGLTPDKVACLHGGFLLVNNGRKKNFS